MSAPNPVTQYITDIDKIYRAGNATEHSYRHALLSLFLKITSGLTITNEPKHIECGAPDYIITRNGIPLGYIEAKDITVGLHNKANKEQFDRYRKSLGNLIITDYLTFQLFVDGEAVVSVTIAEEKNGGIIPDKKQFDAFLALASQFSGYSGKTIYQSETLAGIMADKAKLLADVIKSALRNREAEGDTLSGQYAGFKKILIHNLAEDEFADIYAQTLAYGLFAARLNQADGQPFSRILAARLIPQSNPFLRKLFQYIAGFDLDSRICWIVDALADLFNCVAVDEIKKEFDKANQDPSIHFYETFLARYNPKLRESRGVYYTPLPVVKFIVRAVDDILKTEFGLKKGLADHSKIKCTMPGKDGKLEPVELHKVQILDPAAGTGTFLAEVIDKIYEYFENDKGAWFDYCDNHLIPRLNGFEILMASYAMAHFKLDMKLKEKGNNRDSKSRLHVYLTNALEEAPESVPELFMAQWLAQEAEEAQRVKRDVPVMVVMANPPYNVSTQNRNAWIDGLISDYKKDLNEKKINLDDDYIKFIRYGQYLIEKNTSGIMAYISNNSFIDGITHRGMRKMLLECFDKIYIFDLHGSTKKKETAPDESKDENVFDIQQGVSINIFIKTTDSTEPAKVYHRNLFGKREGKYRFLFENELYALEWQELKPEAPWYFFVPKNFNNQRKYEKGFLITELFNIYNNAIKTDRDALFIDMDKNALEKRMKMLLERDYNERFAEMYKVQDSSSYKLLRAIKNNRFEFANITTIQYRPFDYRYIYYKQGITSRPAFNVMKHLEQENIALLTCRQQSTFDFHHIFLSKALSEVCTISLQTKETAYVFPLYLYPDKDTLDKTERRRPNLNMEIVTAIAQKINLTFTAEKEQSKSTFSPLDILDYIYAVLYNNKYREKYKEFLKIDFPRVPYPHNADQFNRLASLGSQLRLLHLMENITAPSGLAAFPNTGTNEIEHIQFAEGKVSINKAQYFDKVPREAWEYYIGGYQPAQKWLKDRKGRVLSFEDIEHYQKIIFVLKMTMEFQRQVDEVMGVE